MIAAVIALAGVCAALAGLSVTTGIWLHSANADRLNAADLIDGQRKLAVEFKSKYDAEFAAHVVTSKQLEQERQLRGVAEAQRNEAQRKTRDLLRKHAKDVSDDEIREMVAGAFSVGLAIVPTPVPHLSDDPRDGLLDPSEL